MSKLINIVEKTIRNGGFDDVMHVENPQFFNDVAWGDGYIFQSDSSAITVWIPEDMETVVFYVSPHASEMEAYSFLEAHWNVAFKAAVSDDN